MATEHLKCTDIVKNLYPYIHKILCKNLPYFHFKKKKIIGSSRLPYLICQDLVFLLLTKLLKLQLLFRYVKGRISKVAQEIHQGKC